MLIGAIFSFSIPRDGYASRFAASEISSTGRTSRGVKALSLRLGDKMADMDILTTSTSAISAIVTETDEVSGNKALVYSSYNNN